MSEDPGSIIHYWYRQREIGVDHRPDTTNTGANLNPMQVPRFVQVLHVQLFSAQECSVIMSEEGNVVWWRVTCRFNMVL